MVAPAVLFQHYAPDYAVRVVRYPAFQRMPRHAHENCGISVVLDGELVEEAENASVVASAGWSVVKPEGLYHANRFGARGATLLAVTPLGAAVSDLDQSWQWTARPAVFHACLRLVKRHPAHADDSTASLLSDLLASLTPAPNGRNDVPWLRRIKRSLDEFAAPSVAELASDAGVHPVYLARAFRAAFGVSIREYRQQVQIRRATQLVVTTRLPLAQVALDCGFVDHSHMCRTFRMVAGWNPGTLRR